MFRRRLDVIYYRKIITSPRKKIERRAQTFVCVGGYLACWQAGKLTSCLADWLIGLAGLFTACAICYSLVAVAVLFFRKGACDSSKLWIGNPLINKKFLKNSWRTFIIIQAGRIWLPFFKANIQISLTGLNAVNFVPVRAIATTSTMMLMMIMIIRMMMQNHSVALKYSGTNGSWKFGRIDGMGSVFMTSQNWVRS